MREYLKQGTFENENEGWRYLLETGYPYLRGKERLLLPTAADRPGRYRLRQFRVGSDILNTQDEDIMTQIVLVRHGQTEWNRVERFRGRFDVR